MKRSITRTIMLVTTMTVFALGVPLAVAVHHTYDGDAVVRLQRRAALAIGEVTLPLDAVTVTNALSEPDDPPDVAVYDHLGTLLTGPGPAIGDQAVAQALHGQPAALTIGSNLVVATPVNDRTTERVVGAVRVSTPEWKIWQRTLTAWALMTGVASAALAGAWLAARRQGQRLGTPINALALRAAVVGAGQLPGPTAPTGIAEVDAVADALNASALQLAELLARERAFSSDVSHQLRTPLTRLRLTIEQSAGPPDDAERSAVALREIDHIEATVDHLFALARGRHPKTSRTNPATALEAAAVRWNATTHRHARHLTIDVPTTLEAVTATSAALDQILDVLVDNAIRHGTGTITLRARHTPGSVAIHVTDEGDGIGKDTDIFRRKRHHDHHGIGLPLARTLVEADGGRLTLHCCAPTTFQIIYTTAPDDGEAP